MNLNNLKSLFLDLSLSQRAQFLAALAHEITIYAREAHHQGERAIDVTKLITFNEELHIVIGQICHLLEEDEKRYDDAGLVDILWQRAIEGGCENELAYAFQSAINYIENLEA